MRNSIRSMFVAGLMFMGAGVSLCPGQTRGPTIAHEPVNVAARGQAISILARVKPGSAAIKTVALYYTPSRDASPIKQPMTLSGGGVYVGTIPTTYLATAPTVHYYLEAVDRSDEWAETQWAQIQIRDGRSPSQPLLKESAPNAYQASPSVAGSQSTNNKELSTAAMVGGGILAAGATVAIIAAADSGGGGGGGGAGGDDTDPTPDTPTCAIEDAVGTWTGTTVAPGFILNADGRAQYFATVNGSPDEGAWGLIGCTLTLAPSSTTNSLYRGSGDLAADKASVTINGVTYTKL